MFQIWCKGPTDFGTVSLNGHRTRLDRLQENNKAVKKLFELEDVCKHK